MRLRQVALLAESLAGAEVCGVLDLEVCFRDPAVERWGLGNSLLPSAATSWNCSRRSGKAPLRAGT